MILGLDFIAASSMLECELGKLTSVHAFAERCFLPRQHHQHPAEPAARGGQPAARTNPHGHDHFAAGAARTACH